MSIAYRRVILKLSGEALAGSQGYGIDPAIMGRIAGEIGQIADKGVSLGVVVGGGNLFRGAWLEKQGTDRVVGDHMGMLATVMNGLALGEALKARGVNATVLSATPIPEVCESFTQRTALAAMERPGVTVFVAGIGNPFLTTDTTAAMRAAEMSADVIVKATNVDGVYTADPRKDPMARRYDRISFDEVIAKGLAVMDTAAFALARDNRIPIIIFSIHEPGALQAVLEGTGVYTLVDPGA
ncbi:MAG: UMP kinase [Hyphomicrobiaceae bacterium]|nr:UMP kinase [Hyphomicrobiaceae bacterium]